MTGQIRSHASRSPAPFAPAMTSFLIFRAAPFAPFLSLRSVALQGHKTRWIEIRRTLPRKGFPHPKATASSFSRQRAGRSRGATCALRASLRSVPSTPQTVRRFSRWRDMAGLTPLDGSRSLARFLEFEVLRSATILPQRASLPSVAVPCALLAGPLRAGASTCPKGQKCKDLDQMALCPGPCLRAIQSWEKFVSHPQLAG